MQLPPRYQAVLRHVARYRLTLRAVIGKLLLPATGEPPPSLLEERRSQGGNVLVRLTSYGLLNHHHHKSKEFPPLAGNVPYFTLTPAGAKAVGAPADRAEELGKALGLGPDAVSRVQTVQVPLIDLSSTDLRRRAAAGRSLRYLVPRAVECYIHDKRLYTT